MSQRPNDCQTSNGDEREDDEEIVNTPEKWATELGGGEKGKGDIKKSIHQKKKSPTRRWKEKAERSRTLEGYRQRGEGGER